jgi:hypothetical protein
MGKKRKSPWPFQKVLGSKRQFILLFGAHECFLPVLGHIRQPNSPNSWLFPFYHYPQSRGITCLLDMKRSFFGLSLSKRKGLALFTTFFTAPMGRGKIQWHLFKSRYTRRTGSVGASSTAAPLARIGSWPCGAKRLSHRTVAGAGGACGRSATIVGNADEQRSARRLSLCAASASMAS